MGRQIDKQMDRETGKQTDKQIMLDIDNLAIEICGIYKLKFQIEFLNFK
jgi:hypothetical protein